jgi:pectin methylesterase-like acyl-CoA thioesterase
VSVRSLALTFVAVMTLAACNSIPLHTAPGPAAACDEALATGTLTSNRPNGLALQTSDDQVLLVLWPFGYTSRGFVGSMELVDPSGATIAREGDVVEMTGGTNGDGTFVACAGTVKRAASR